MIKSLKDTVLLLSWVIFILFLGYLYYSGSLGVLGNQKYVVDLKKIFQTSDYFQQARDAWDRDRQILEKRYQDRLSKLKKIIISSGLMTSDLKNKILNSNGNNQNFKSSGKTSHHDGFTSGKKERIRVKFKTLYARKNRVQFIIEQKRKELVRRGHQRVRKAVKAVAQSRGLDRVYRKPELLYKSGGTRSDTSTKGPFLDITTEVMSQLRTK